MIIIWHCGVVNVWARRVYCVELLCWLCYCPPTLLCDSHLLSFCLFFCFLFSNHSLLPLY